MLYRCRWCERAYCEDCLDWDKTTLIGNNLLEYEVLGYGELPQAFYIVCHGCNDHFEEVPGDKKLCDGLAEGFKLDHDKMYGGHGGQREMSTRAGSLTDATTIETPGANTPIVIDDDIQILPNRKRKLITNHDSDRDSVKSQRFS